MLSTRRDTREIFCVTQLRQIVRQSSDFQRTWLVPEWKKEKKREKKYRLIEDRSLTVFPRDVLDLGVSFGHFIFFISSPWWKSLRTTAGTRETRALRSCRWHCMSIEPWLYTFRTLVRYRELHTTAEACGSHWEGCFVFFSFSLYFTLFFLFFFHSGIVECRTRDWFGEYPRERRVNKQRDWVYDSKVVDALKFVLCSERPFRI